MESKKDDFYRKLRRNIQGYLKEKGRGFQYADFLLAAPDLFHLLCKLAMDRRVSLASKALIASAIAYFVAPVDVIPEGLLGPAGYVDDVAVAALALNQVVNAGNGEVAAEHWAGDGNLLELLQSIIGVADNMVGNGAWSKLKGMFGQPKL